MKLHFSQKQVQKSRAAAYNIVSQANFARLSLFNYISSHTLKLNHPETNFPSLSEFILMWFFLFISSLLFLRLKFTFFRCVVTISELFIFLVSFSETRQIVVRMLTTKFSNSCSIKKFLNLWSNFTIKKTAW